ncbi:ABC transporter ATP-binding protein [Clostridium sp. BL-8]|uniref:ABC transporter ATP-binding protein n=1 Tax=Clostridium sp. BL-8 TaxID=349938 RepID=UPI0009C7E757|nr:ABC transporter ATP-binding protein [Clostridium sp. BL-8]OOM78104.1 putative ABC transporter ATP-binding protein [Clostridium sp. BL-8]
MISTDLNSMKKTMNLEMKPPKKTKTIRRLIKLMLPYKKGMVFAFTCAILVNIATLIKPYILKLVIDDFLTKHIAQRGFYSITTMGIIYFLVVALSGFLSVSQAFLINKVGQDVMKTLRSRVFKTIQLLPLSYLDKTSSGRLITRATNDVEALSEMYTDVIISLFKDVILIIGIVYTMVIINVRLALISFCVVPLMFGVVFALKTRIKRNFAKMKSLIGKINGFMAENISGMKIIQIFDGEKEKEEAFSNLNNEYFKATLFQVWMNSFLKPAADVFQSLAVAILIWYGMGKISDNTLSIGVLYAFTNYIKQFFDPISDMADNYTTIQSALVSADRIFELLDQEEYLEDLDLGVEANNFRGDIEFKNIWFSYNDKDWVLKDVSFKISKGQTAAFVGQTGSGKTTIISLLSGFYEVQKGEILIDGININEIKKRDLRKNISVVLQDVFLFSGTIENNITLNDIIDQSEIERALEISRGKDVIENFENGIKEPVMERGSTLSAGQRQLISFARAIAHNPSIFVLDEATANIDTATEMLIQKAIDNITKEKTTIIIAHRLSTIRNADVIVVLKNGQVLEAGNHDSLMKAGGYYKELIIKK